MSTAKRDWSKKHPSLTYETVFKTIQYNNFSLFRASTLAFPSCYFAGSDDISFVVLLVARKQQPEQECMCVGEGERGQTLKAKVTALTSSRKDCRAGTSPLRGPPESFWLSLRATMNSSAQSEPGVYKVHNAKSISKEPYQFQ